MTSQFLNPASHVQGDESARHSRSAFESLVKLPGEETDDEEDSILADRSLFHDVGRVPVSIVPNPKRINTFGGFSNTNFLSSSSHEHPDSVSRNGLFSSNSASVLNSNHSHNIHVGANFSNLHQESHQEISIALGITPRPTSGISDLATPGLPDTYYDHISTNGSSKKAITPLQSSKPWPTNDMTLGTQSMTTGNGIGNGHWSSHQMDPIVSNPIVSSMTPIAPIATPSNASLLDNLLEPPTNPAGPILRPPGLSTLNRATSSLGLGIPSSNTLNDSKNPFFDSIISPINRPASTPVYTYNSLGDVSSSLAPGSLYGGVNTFGNNLIPSTTSKLADGHGHGHMNGLDDLLSSLSLHGATGTTATATRNNNNNNHLATLAFNPPSQANELSHGPRVTSTTSFEYDLNILTGGGSMGSSETTSPLDSQMTPFLSSDPTGRHLEESVSSGPTNASAAWPVPMRYQYHQQQHHHHSATSPNLPTNPTPTNLPTGNPNGGGNNSSFYQHNHGSSNNMLAGLLGNNSNHGVEGGGGVIAAGAAGYNYHTNLHTPTAVQSNGTVIIGGRGGLIGHSTTPLPLGERPGSRTGLVHPTTKSPGPLPYNAVGDGMVTRPVGYSTSPVPHSSHTPNHHLHHAGNGNGNGAAGGNNNNRYHHTPHSNPLAAQKLSLHNVDERAIANVILSNCYHILLDAANHGLKAVELANTLRARVGTEVLAMVRERWGGLLALLEQHPDQFTVERVPKNDRVVLTRPGGGNGGGAGTGDSSTTTEKEGGVVEERATPVTDLLAAVEAEGSGTTGAAGEGSGEAGESQEPIDALAAANNTNTTANNNNSTTANNNNQTPSRCLHVGNVPSHFTEVDLMKEFDKFGIIEGIKLIVPKNQARRFAFITFQTVAQAITAKQCLSKIYPWKSAISFAHKESNPATNNANNSTTGTAGNGNGVEYARPGHQSGYAMQGQGQGQGHYPRHHSTTTAPSSAPFPTSYPPHHQHHHNNNHHNNSHNTHHQSTNHYHNNHNASSNHHQHPHHPSRHHGGGPHPSSATTSSTAATSSSSSSSSSLVEREDFTIREQYILQRLCDDTYVPTQPWPQDEAVDRLFVQAIREQIFQFGGNYTTTISKLRGFLKHRIGTSSNIKSVPLKALLQAYPQYFALHGNVVSLVLGNNTNNNNATTNHTGSNNHHHHNNNHHHHHNAHHHNNNTTGHPVYHHQAPPHYAAAAASVPGSGMDGEDGEEED